MPDVVVLGAGVAGLTTALVLLDRGCSVEIWTRDDPLDTVSAIAGAIWYPFLADPRERVLGWSAATFRMLAQLADNAATGVQMQPVVEVFQRPDPELWWRSAVDRLAMVPGHELPAPYQAAAQATVPVCDTTIYLPWLLHQVRARGGTMVRRSVVAFDEAFAVASVVVNCTGLGAAALCNDPSVRPVRGQVVLARSTPVRFALIDDDHGRPVYVLPRRHDLVLGGTAQFDDTRLQPDDDDTAKILAAVRARMPELREVAATTVRVGLRPHRPEVRLELERLPGNRRLAHNYGHGGSGYTLAWGCAQEIATLLGAGQD
ncbi:MAG: FAD-dependent oxidoreductase [Planctomycetes bacterium]|nr:FAD-dependent oxidoreductase [Planctomycetota bacterium]